MNTQIECNNNSQNENNLSKRMYYNVVLNYTFRGIGLVASFILTKINLSYLGVTLFGQWATITSIASWTGYGDIGIGNGFRNEFTKAVAENDNDKKAKLIASAVVMLSKLSGIVFAILFLISEILFLAGILESSLRVPMHITNLFFCIDLVFGVVRSIAFGYQKSWYTSLSQLITMMLRIVGTLLLCTSSPNLVLFSLVNGIALVTGNAILLLMALKIIKGLFINRFRSFVDRSYIYPVVRLGLRFFILQLSGLILYSTDNVIIKSTISADAVTEYDIITKVYNSGDELFAILLVSFWSAVTYAAVKNNYNWIRKEIKRLLLIWTLFSISVVVVSIGFNDIVKIWLGKDAPYFETSIICLFAVYTIWGTFGSIFVNVSNGLGRLKLQLICSSVEAVINIPLSICFAHNLGMGIFGVKLATLICCVGANIIIPIDVILLMKRRNNTNE